MASGVQIKKLKIQGMVLSLTKHKCTNTETEALTTELG